MGQGSGLGNSLFGELSVPGKDGSNLEGRGLSLVTCVRRLNEECDHGIDDPAVRIEYDQTYNARKW